MTLFFFAGECWSDANAEQKYIKYGSSEKCFQNYNQTCPQGSSPCAGGADANFVYRIDASKWALNVRQNFEKKIHSKLPAYLH